MIKKLAIVSGGSSGLGFCISRRLTAQGYNVAIIGQDNQKLISAKEKLLSVSSSKVLVFCGNIAEENFVKEIYEIISDNGFCISELYNCAGSGKFGSPEITTRKMVDFVFEGSLIGTILMSTHALIHMKEHGGTIVNVMSTAALRGNVNESVYCAAKWGARGYTEALKVSVKGSKIRVVGAYPGGMNTPFWKSDTGFGNVDASKLMDPDEVAQQIVFASSAKKTMCVSDISIENI